jgi:hypothetical protein
VVLAYTTPLRVAPGATMLLGEQPGARRSAGVAPSLAGLGLMFNPLAFDWHDRDSLIGNGALLLAAFFLGWQYPAHQGASLDRGASRPDRVGDGAGERDHRRVRPRHRRVAADRVDTESVVVAAVQRPAGKRAGLLGRGGGGAKPAGGHDVFGPARRAGDRYRPPRR